MPMHPLLEAVEVKGSREFTRSELVGLLSFRLRRMPPSEAKRAVEEWLSAGLLEERGEVLVANLEALTEEGGDLFEEMVGHIAEALGWEREDVLDGVAAMRERYGDLDKRVLAYLFGMEKGVDMSRFKDRLEP